MPLCPNCNGTGMVTEVIHLGGKAWKTLKTCPHCKGTGKG